MPHEVVAGAIIVAPAVLAAGSREPSAPRYIVVNGRNITQPKVNNEMVTFERHISQYDFLDHFARYTHRPRFRAFLSKEHSSVASSRRSRQECRAPMLGIALKMAYRRPSLSSTISLQRVGRRQDHPRIRVPLTWLNCCAIAIPLAAVYQLGRYSTAICPEEMNTRAFADEFMSTPS